MNITTAPNTDARNEQMHDMCFSDFHKDVYGYRPRGDTWEYYANLTAEEFNSTIDSMMVRMDENEKQEKLREEAAVEAFKQSIQKAIEAGAKDEETALRWLTQNETFYHGQSVDQWVWEQGILFTSYGTELAKKLYNIVDYVQDEVAA